MRYTQFYAVNHSTGVVLPNAVVSVKYSDSGALATLFTEGGAPMGNPMTATSSGLVGFATLDGTYDIEISSGPYSAPPISSFEIVDTLELKSDVQLIKGGSLTGNAAFFETTAGLADLNFNAGKLAIVENDTPRNGSIYQKVGASGTGSWTKTSLSIFNGTEHYQPVTQDNTDGKAFVLSMTDGIENLGDMGLTLFGLDIQYPMVEGGVTVELIGFNTGDPRQMVMPNGDQIPMYIWTVGQRILFRYDGIKFVLVLPTSGVGSTGYGLVVCEATGSDHIVASPETPVVNYGAQQVFAFFAAGTNTSNPDIVIEGLNDGDPRLIFLPDLATLVPPNTFVPGTWIEVKFNPDTGYVQLVSPSVGASGSSSLVMGNQTNVSGYDYELDPQGEFNISSIMVMRIKTAKPEDVGVVIEIAGFNTGDVRQLRTPEGSQIPNDYWQVGDLVGIRYDLDTGLFFVVPFFSPGGSSPVEGLSYYQKVMALRTNANAADARRISLRLKVDKLDAQDPFFSGHITQAAGDTTPNVLRSQTDVRAVLRVTDHAAELTEGLGMEMLYHTGLNVGMIRVVDRTPGSVGYLGMRIDVKTFELYREGTRVLSVAGSQMLPDALAINWAAGVTVASAATADICSSASNRVTISGSTTITSLGNTGVVGGEVRWVRFSGTPLLTYNASSLILPTAANIQTEAGDTALFVHLGSGNWRCLDYNRASGKALVETTPEQSLPTVPTVLRDDFFFASAESGEIGEMGWSYAGGQCAMVAAVANHPGVVFRNTSATINTIASLFMGAAGSTSILMFSNFDETTWVIMPSTADADQRHRYGVFDDVSADTITHGVYFERLGTDTNWFAVCKNNGTETRSDMGVAFAATTWYKLRIRKISSTSVGFSINGGTEVVVSANVPDATDGVGPGNQIKNLAAVDKSCRFDFFSLKTTSLVR